jgi:hypothetical protein
MVVDRPHRIFRKKSSSAKSVACVIGDLCLSRSASNHQAWLNVDFRKILCCLDFLFLLHQGKRKGKINIISSNSFYVVCLFLLFSCTKKTNAPPSSAPINDADLAGTKWRIYQYKDATTTTPQPRADTLIFIDATTYKYNNQTFNYNLTNGDYTHLTLGQTPFGDLDGTVPNNFIQNTEIINTPFNQLKPTGTQTYFLWIKKL